MRKCSPSADVVHLPCHCKHAAIASGRALERRRPFQAGRSCRARAVICLAAQRTEVPQRQAFSQASSHGMTMGYCLDHLLLSTAHGINRRLTPHSGYHFDGSSRRFFEGWYFKVRQPLISRAITAQLADAVCCPPLCMKSMCIGRQVTLPGSGQSFALIYSVSDPAGSNRFSSTAAQARQYIHMAAFMPARRCYPLPVMIRRILAVFCAGHGSWQFILATV